MDFADLTTKLAAIRERIISTVERINKAAGGEPFYARITLEDRHLTGFVENLRVNQYKLLFDFTEEKLIGEETVRKKSSKEIKFEKLREINIFKTLSGRPISLGGK